MSVSPNTSSKVLGPRRIRLPTKLSAPGESLPGAAIEPIRYSRSELRALIHGSFFVAENRIQQASDAEVSSSAELEVLSRYHGSSRS